MIDELPDGDPEAAAYYDFNRREIMLNCGATVPIVAFFDHDGQPVADHELDLFDTIGVAFGPGPSGRTMVCELRRTLVELQ